MSSCNSSFYTEVLLQDLENICGTDRIIKLISPTVLKLIKSLAKTEYVNAAKNSQYVKTVI